MQSIIFPDLVIFTCNFSQLPTPKKVKKNTVLLHAKFSTGHTEQRYHVYPKYSDKQFLENKVDPDNVLYCLPHIQKILDKLIGRKMDLFKF